MKKLTLTNSAQNNTTVLENEFIDQYMIKANGEYVKVYLLLLRHQNEASTPLGMFQSLLPRFLTSGSLRAARNLRSCYL